jgi:ribonuclease T2
MSSLIGLAALVSVVHAKFNYPLAQILSTYPNIESCVGLPVQYSCENTTVLTDSCCNVAPGGLVLQTQFWDTYTGLESQGQLLPQGSWGIHGLWPDNCDG